jgi:hypothetical protein
MSALQRRQDALIEMNVNRLEEAIGLLMGLDDGTFTTSPPGMEPHRASAHLRHVIEFYECFLNGVEACHIDYDARRRDPQLERSRLDSIARLRELADRLRTSPALRGDSIVFVKAEDADASGMPDPYLTSSVGRELLILASHTVHHFALIALTLRAHGSSTAPDFGVAPSTLRYQAA